MLIAVVLTLALGSGNASAQRPLGIDVSSHEGSGIDWQSVTNAGYVFAWAKATEGVGYEDADFVENITNAQAAGVVIGCSEKRGVAGRR